MERRRLAESDYRFMCVVWDHEPISSTRLADRCFEELGWKKSTSFTMLRKMLQKNYVKKENSAVTSLVSREQVRAEESALFVQQTFAGSLPDFLVSFLGGKTISGEEADALRLLIEEHREG